MNNDERFEQIYSEILENNSEDMELFREQAKKESFIDYGIAILLIIIGLINCYILIFCFSTYSMYYFNMIYFVLALFIFRRFKGKRKNSKISKYKEEFKLKIVKSLLDSFNEQIEYFPKEGINSKIYDDAEFEKYNIYRSDDLMEGVLKNKCNFSMAEVLTEKETKDSDGDTHYKTLFWGMVAKIETPKPFNACLYLRTDSKDKNILGKFLSIPLPFDNLRVEMDSQEFEKIFDVYATDKIIAMQLLTSDIMQQLIDFREEMNMQYELTIKNNCIYIRFKSGKMFETARVTKFSLDKKTLYKYYKMLDFTFSLTNKLINLINDVEYDY